MKTEKKGVEGQLDIFEAMNRAADAIGDVATLIEQWHDGGHGFRGSIKVILSGFHALAQVRWQKVEIAHHIDQISRSARSKPVGINFLLGKAG